MGPGTFGETGGFRAEQRRYLQRIHCDLVGLSQLDRPSTTEDNPEYDICTPWLGRVGELECCSPCPLIRLRYISLCTRPIDRTRWVPSHHDREFF